MVRDIIIPIGGIHPPEPNNQCSLCKKTVSPSRLTRCPRCKKLFCKSCITEDLREGEYLICLNCARRYVSPRAKAFKSKYMLLTLFLTRKAKWKIWLKLQFSQIEGLIGADIPEAAHKNTGWWKKTGSAHTEAWSRIGWSIKEVNLKEKTVIFTRPELLKKEDKPKKLSPNVRLPEYKPKKRKTPSLTKIAIAQARLKNSAIKRSAMKKYRGKFRPKSAYEKRLWSSDEKP